MARRRVAILAALAMAAAGIGVGVAAASNDWGPGTVATPRGYFDFCQDKQRDIAGITEADLAGENNGGNDFGISAQIYPNTAPGAGDQNSYELPGFFNFVTSKSGITTEAESGPERQILVTQFVEYRDTAGQHPTQIRCKMRSTASLNQAGFQKNNDSDPAPTNVPWGFGAGTASGPAQDCSVVNQESIQNAWAQLTEQEKDDAPFRPEPRQGDPANIDLVPDEFAAVGPVWTEKWDGLQVDGDVLKVRSHALIASTTDPGVASDKFRGSHYCTFVAPEYLVDTFTGAVTPPAVNS